MPESSNVNRSAIYAVLFVLCAATMFWRLGATPLLGFDEQIYSECSREMLASGDFMVPRVDSEYFFDKPPLVYWMQAGSMRLLGVNSLGARLPSAMVGLLLVGWTVFLGNTLFGRKAGVLSGSALASSVLFVAVARMAIMDQAFSLMISLALGAFLLAYLGIWPRSGYIAAWAAMALASLIKGPAGAVLVLATVGVFIVLRRDWRATLRGTPVLGLVVFLVIGLPWYLLVHKQTAGAFTQEFIIHQNVARAMGEDFYHNSPWFTYIPLFALGCFPWSIFVIRAWISHVKLRPADEDKTGQAALFAAVWMASIVGLFSLSKSKLPGYIVPSLPGAALLVGLAWSRIVDSGKTAALKPYAVASVVVGGLFAAAMQVGQRYLDEPIPGLSTALLPMSICLFAGPVLALVLIRASKPVGAFAMLCAGMAGFLVFAVWLGMPIASRKMSDPMVKMAQLVRSQVPPGETVVTYMHNPEQPAFAFYAGHPIPDKDDGQSHGGRKDLDAVLSAGKPVFIIAQRDKLEGLPADAELIATAAPYALYRIDRR